MYLFLMFCSMLNLNNVKKWSLQFYYNKNYLLWNLSLFLIYFDWLDNLIYVPLCHKYNTTQLIISKQLMISNCVKYNVTKFQSCKEITYIRFITIKWITYTRYSRMNNIVLNLLSWLICLIKRRFFPAVLS